MPAVQDTLQWRRNQFAKGFFALPLIFVAWGFLSLIWTHAVYGNVVPATWPPPGSAFTYWLLLATAFLVPILIASLLARGVPLDQAPVLAAVIVLGGIGVLLALAVSGFSVLDGRVFIELFLTGALLLAYCVALLHVKRVKTVIAQKNERARRR